VHKSVEDGILACAQTAYGELSHEALLKFYETSYHTFNSQSSLQIHFPYLVTRFWATMLRIKEEGIEK
jgi:hypothetical protein